MINIHFEASLCIIDKTTSWALPMTQDPAPDPQCRVVKLRISEKKFKRFRHFSQKAESIYFKDRAI